MSTPTATPSPRPQAAPTPPPAVAPKPIVVSTVKTSSPSVPQLLESPLAVSVSKVAYQKLTNNPGLLTGPITVVQNLGGIGQAASTTNALIRSAGSNLLDLIESVGTFAAESGL